MLTCDVVHTAQGARFLGAPFSDDDFAVLTDDYGRLEERVMAQFAAEGTGAGDVALVREVGVRYRKQAHTLVAEVDSGRLSLGSATPIQERFERRYVSVYGEGAVLSGGAIELEAQFVNGTRQVPPPPLREHELVAGDGSDAKIATREAHFGGAFRSTPVLDGAKLRAGETVTGPAIVQRMGDSAVIPDRFAASVDRFLTLELKPV
jgi:N-methylhydantoinase A/oxoprolinase/acetone carboxylase beta subunit